MLGSSRQGIEAGQCYGLGGKQKLEEVAASSNGDPTYPNIRLSMEMEIYHVLSFIVDNTDPSSALLLANKFSSAPLS